MGGVLLVLFGFYLSYSCSVGVLLVRPCSTCLVGFFPSYPLAWPPPLVLVQPLFYRVGGVPAPLPS